MGLNKKESQRIQYVNNILAMKPDELDSIFTVDLNISELRFLINNSLQELALYINVWGSKHEHKEHENGGHATPWGLGYQQAIRDIWFKFPILSEVLNNYYGN